MTSGKLLRSLDRANAVIHDEFWLPRLSQMSSVTVNDVFTKFETRGGDVFENFRRVAARKTGGHFGLPFFDGLVYETIRGASDFLADSRDAALDHRMDAYIDLIAAAQAADSDGYINTFTTLTCPEHRWGENGGNLLWQHDVYNAGCLVDAAVHHYRATGKLTLLGVAVRFADYMSRSMGPAPRKNIVPGHPLPERALVELYRLFRAEPALRARFRPGVQEERYLELARFWIDTRGNHEGRASYPRYLGEYAQDHVPLLEQHEAVGHAVRATLCYDGAVNVGIETGDHRYLVAMKRIWESAAFSKMLLSGGVGTEHSEEKFSYEYRLPNNAYLETCAAIGLAFWSGSMNRAFGEARYSDVVEQALYNAILSGLSRTGDRYFYQNPLLSAGDVHRWEWHACPCCPPMILKIMGDLHSFIYGVDDSGIALNLFVAGSADFTFGGQPARLRVHTRYPWDGDVQVSVDPGAPCDFVVRLRIPWWCRTWRISVNGQVLRDARVENGYAVVDRTWKDGDQVLLSLEMPVERMEAHPYVEADRGFVALQRGPLLYCLEGADNPSGVERTLPQDPAFVTEWRSDLLGGIMAVRGTDSAGSSFMAVPYHAWDNRAPGPMRVWLRQDGAGAKGLNIDGWAGKLYRPYGAKRET